MTSAGISAWFDREGNSLRDAAARLVAAIHAAVYFASITISQGRALLTNGDPRASRDWHVLMCDFDTGFRPPEMVKRRQVVVISPKIAARAGLCTVVPLSMTAPAPVMPYHCQIDLPGELPDWMEKSGVWVKADMMFAAGLQRLDLIRLGKDDAGRRRYCYKPITSENLYKIRKAMLAGLGLERLTNAL